MNKHLKSFVVFSVLLGMLSVVACAPFTPSPRTHAAEMLPEAYSDPPRKDAPLPRWWDVFKGTQLPQLIQEALGTNFSLRESWARLSQANASALQKGAARLPDLTATTGAALSRQLTDAATGTVENYTLGLASSYEVDLWGKIRSEQQAAVLEAEEAREAVYTAATTLAANVATRWVGIVAQRKQKDLLVRQLAVNETLLELVELRFRKSLATALDVFQQRQLVAQSKAQLPLVESSERQLLNELAVLLGRVPFALPVVADAELALPEAVPATGLPAQLLENRPDVRQAMRRIDAADWNLAAAKADRLPAIRLSAGASAQSDTWGALFDNWILSLAGNMSATLFDGDRRKYEVLRQVALVDAAVAAYGQRVLNAMREVEDALIREAKLKQYLRSLGSQIEAAQNALNEARSRYRRGLSDYLPVLTQLLAVQGLQRTQIQRQADLLVARVDLYRSLGGSWTTTLTPPKNRNP